MKDGYEIVIKACQQIEKIKCDGKITPKILSLGSYAYYLLKTYCEQQGFKKTETYKPLHSILIMGYELKICIDPETTIEGQIKESSSSVEVYGN